MSFIWYVKNKSPVKYQEVTKLNSSGNLGIGTSPPTYQINQPDPNAPVVMHDNSTEQNEMIKIAKDGFYVRGVRVPADDKEAETVYNAFKQWLAWSNLQRD